MIFPGERELLDVRGVDLVESGVLNGRWVTPVNAPAGVFAGAFNRGGGEQGQSREHEVEQQTVLHGTRITFRQGQGWTSKIGGEPHEC